MKRDIFKRYGIQNKFLRYVLALLALTLLLSSTGVVLVAKNNFYENTLNNYRNLTEKITTSLSNEFDKSNEVTKKFIIQDLVQKSLSLKVLSINERNQLKESFSYLNFDHVQEYIYVDNKNNLYTQVYRNITISDFEKSSFDNLLGDEYSKTKWFWENDFLFRSHKPSLFIGRYIRNMDSDTNPGFLFFKMSDGLLESILGEGNSNDAISVNLVDQHGKIFYSNSSKDSYLSVQSLQKMEKALKSSQEKKDADSIKSIHFPEGTVLYQREEKTGFAVVTIVPIKVLYNGIFTSLFTLIAIYLLVLIFAVCLSIYFSKRFTSPIKKISKAMSMFDGKSFSQKLNVRTYTELDEIGLSYNKLLINVEELMNEVKMQEKALRDSELHLLMYQINPHFLYNTLDTIYMLARINNEKTTMKMIQSLSKFLKVGLSNGENIISIEDEIDHVISYMEIQKIRNPNLFTYQLNTQIDIKNTKIAKLTLQPLVENSIKYGFSEIYEGGFIDISIYWEDDFLVLNVFNNGEPINPNMLEKLNKMKWMPLQELEKLFNEKQKGFGIRNVITRLRLMYGENIQFYYKSFHDGTVVTIKIPKGEIENEA